MFTGLVQGIGSVSNIIDHEDSMELELEIGELANEVSIGDSISVNGTCLTVTKIDSERIYLDVMKQTLNLTNLKDSHILGRVNLELAVYPHSA